MLNPSFTTIFKALGFFLFLLAALATVFEGQRVLLDNYSTQRTHVYFGNLSPERLMNTEVILVGDSTVRMMDPKESDQISERGVANLSLGGSVVSDWYYHLRNTLRAPNAIKVIAFGFVNPCDRLHTYKYNTSYLPFLLSWKDLFSEPKKVIPLKFAWQLLPYVILPLSYARGDVLTGFMADMFPSLYELQIKILKAEIEKRNLRAQKSMDSTPNQDLWGDFNRLLDLLKSYEKRAVFTISPVGTKIRDERFKSCVRDFMNICKEKNLYCQDFSAKVDDSFFGSDHVHLLPEKLYLHRDLIKKAIFP